MVGRSAVTRSLLRDIAQFGSPRLQRDDTIGVLAFFFAQIPAQRGQIVIEARG